MRDKIGICIIVLLSVLVALVVLNGIEAKLVENEHTAEKASEILIADERTATVEKEVKPFEFVLKIEDDYVVVYTKGGEEFYFGTGIKIEDLPAQIADKIILGYGFETEADLYDFLENYSS